VAPTGPEGVLSVSRLSVVGLILVATVLFVVGIVWEKNSGEHHSESVAQASETSAEKAGESGGSSASSTEGGAATETPAEHAAEAGGETSGESGEKVLGISYESTPLVIAAVLASLGLAAIVWFGRAPWLLLVVAVAMLAFAVFDVAEVFHQIDRSEGGIAALAGLVAALHLAAGLGSARLRREAPAS
jgi:hypothetical protein